MPLWMSNPVPREEGWCPVSINLLLEPRDIWIGVFVKGTYWEMGSPYLSLYVCVIPMLPILVSIRLKRWSPT